MDVFDPKHTCRQFVEVFTEGASSRQERAGLTVLPVDLLPLA